MTFGSVCSGIEAASVAWEPLGWSCAFVAEIDPAPSAVLAHRYPGVPNLGDFTAIDASAGPIGLLVGGTPCQGLSLAGFGRGLDDDRSKLALGFIELAYGLRPEWVVWENVASAVSINEGRDFAQFIGEFTGLDVEVPPGGWKTGGIIPGASTGHYGFAYRVLDAQHFGCAMSRGRVFAVGHLGDWRPPAAVLLERSCLSDGREGPGAQRRRSPAGIDRGTPSQGRAIAFTDRLRANGRRTEWRIEQAFTPLVRRAGGSKTARQILAPDGSLRTLTPRETERLFGFPDDWTLIPFGGGMMADTHRNAMLGNSIAVPVIRWLGRRIDMVSRLTEAL